MSRFSRCCRQAIRPIHLAISMRLFGFLDTAPANVAQVRFLQYYFDLFEDLLRAYDEFRWKGVDLICACCPPDGLFPRHLMLGLLHPEKSGQPGQYREPFLPSPAVGCCAGDTKILLQLFTRLVEMVTRFTNAPGLPKFNAKARIDPQIRVTPSVLGDGPIAKQAIPYYYRQNGAPPLYQLWNGEKTRRNRANQNLSYRFDEYKPAAPVFVSDPLRYDLERYNFLRIEGHLGKNYQQVLSTLLLLNPSTGCRSTLLRCAPAVMTIRNPSICPRSRPVFRIWRRSMTRYGRSCCRRWQRARWISMTFPFPTTNCQAAPRNCRCYRSTSPTTVIPRAA